MKDNKESFKLLEVAVYTAAQDSDWEGFEEFVDSEEYEDGDVIEKVNWLELLKDLE